MRLLDILAAAGVAAFAAEVAASQRGTWRLWDATERYATAVRVLLPGAARRAPGRTAVNPDELDAALARWVWQHRRPAGIRAARLVSALAEPAVVYPALTLAGLAGRRPLRAAASACLVVAAGARLLGLPPSARAVVGAVAAAVVGTGRVWLGVHWPGDVLAGYLFAAAWWRAADALGRSATRRPAACRRDDRPNRQVTPDPADW